MAAHPNVPTYLFLALLGLVLSVPVPSAAGPAPSDWGLATPEPEPPLPPEFDAFDPPAIPVASASPIVAEASKTAGPGETFVVSGARLSFRPRFTVYSQQNAGLAKSWWSDGAVASAVLPQALGRWATYAIWPENGAGQGRPFLLNRTELWWVGPASAVPGAQVSAYGRNLSHDNQSAASWVYLKAKGPVPGQWAAVAGVNPYKVDFVLPPGLDSGSYEVWVHNGHGGRFGWSGPAELTVAPSPWAGQESRVFDVRSFGARGDGATDDAGAIDEALSEAQRQAPATIYFPAGRYLVNHGFIPPPRVRWLGDGRDTTAVVAGPGFRGDQADPRSYALLFAEGAAKANAIEVANLTLDGSAHPGLLQHTVYIRFGRDIAFRNARILAGVTGTFNLDGNQGVHLQGTEFVGGVGFLGAASQVFIHGCEFRLTHNANSAITSWGGHGISIIGNSVRDLDATRPEGAGAGRFFVSQGNFGLIEHVFIADNTSRDLGPPTPAWTEFDQNSGEQILFEQCCAALTGNVAAASPTTVTLPANGIADGSDRYGVMVVAGRGLGQHRRIGSYNRSRREASVSPPWTIVPDRTSKVTVAPLAQKIVIYRNQLDGKAGYASASTASSGVRLYANTVDAVVAANRITRVRGGVELWAMGNGAAPEMDAVSFNLVADNLVSDSHDGVSVQTMYLHADVPGAVGHLGNVFRGNQGVGLTGAGIRIVRWGSPNTGAQLADVFESNRFTDVPFGLISDAGSGDARTPLAGMVLQGNVFQLGTAQFSGSSAFSSSGEVPWWGENNTWSGFENAGVSAPSPAPSR